MTTLDAIAFTLAGGSCVSAVSLALLGIAVSYRSSFIAPRATARPRNVIHNPKTDPCSHQSRGNPMLGWIGWTLSLSYDTLLQGVPGTGTREGGRSGSLLKVNLDGIVLLRFHTLGMKITGFATILCLLVVLPINYTSTCYDQTRESGSNVAGCSSASNHTINNYERTTMANIPALLNEATVVFLEYDETRFRLYMIVVVFWAMVAYTMHQLRREWREVLAIRRVYYLEHDVWGARREELKQTLLYEETAQQKVRSKRHFAFDGHEGQRGQKSESTHPRHDEDDDDDDDENLIKRDPWMPHPEQRDTVPNVALYSLLVGGLPSLPEQAADSVDKAVNNQFSKRESIDWQLSLTATFFDHCVPNQPGFSSSVAAVTIAPAAKELANVWRKWYTAAAALRRLRFIRELIAERRNYEIEVDDNDDESQIEIASRAYAVNASNSTCADGDIESGQRRGQARDRGESYDFVSLRGIYEDPLKNKEYFRNVLGGIDEKDDVYSDLAFGPEQAAVYSREFAQAAAPCCPRGCFEGRLRRATIDELMDLEEEAAAEVHQANEELKQARWSVTHADPHGGDVNANLEAAKSGLDATGHRVKPSLLGTDIPSDLHLEAELYNKSSTVGPPPIPAGRRIATSNKNLEAGALRGIPAANVTASSQTNNWKELENLQWQRVETLVRESTNSGSLRPTRAGVASGTWAWPSLRSLIGRTTRQVSKANEWAKNSAEAVESLSRDSTFAIVTFTSRQAAVAARHCLADGRGAERWVALKDLPIPPLADAAAWDLFAYRNCCRPLALGVNDRQKNGRHYITLVVLGIIYVFYTIPLSFASQLVNPKSLENLSPRIKEWSEENGLQISELISGFATALIWSTFFALCPLLFKALANFGSKATSVASAEFKALQYYWWFMVVTAFTSTILVGMAINGVNDGLSLGSELRSVVVAVAQTIPSVVSVSWLNWILFRTLVTLPFSYMLQANTFLFYVVGLKCCSRMVMGGGPGGSTPYRIFVDSGVVIMCALALAPVSPLVAPACFVYFVVCQPLFRRNLIFVYRPKFDGGGFRWPFVFDMCISSMVVGSVLLAGQMGFKEALVPAVLAAVPIAPIFMFRNEMKRRYLQAFNDAALLQTSLLDGWNTEGSSVKKREEFRQFLVDAHKAAYVPVCLADARSDDFLTAEPAVTVPLSSDPDGHEVVFSDDYTATSTEASPHDAAPEFVLGRTKSQRGATMRRTISVLSTARRRTISKGTMIGPDDDEEILLFSPFHRSSGAHVIPSVPFGDKRK